KLEYRLGLGEAPVIDAWLLSDLDDYFTWRGVPTLAPAWAVGLSLTNKHTVLVRHGLGPNRQVVDIATTFDHELAHVAVDVARRGQPVPRWFNEGFASWSAGEWSLERAELVSRSAAQGLLLPMQKIEETFPDHQHSTSLAYAQSHHFVQHMATTYGDDVFAEILGHIADGETFSVAFTYATGDDFEAVEYAWRTALMEHTSPLSNLVDGTWLFFGASLMFLLAWYVRRRRSREKFEHLDDDVTGWDYDPSRYRLPGQDVQAARS
ncbi:MAG: peptidase MA family metallohydrolase, partial [Myxococcota bacterium]